LVQELLLHQRLHGATQFSLEASTENMAAKDNHQNLVANGNLMKPISNQGGSTVHNINVLALSAITVWFTITITPSVPNYKTFWLF
jgi:hypothetical protein